jgi:hypothetical protein
MSKEYLLGDENVKGRIFHPESLVAEMSKG